MGNVDAVETLIERMRRAKGRSPAIYWNGRECSYDELFHMVDEWKAYLRDTGIVSGTVCGFMGEYSPQVCALILALMQSRAILVPFTPMVECELHEFMVIAGVECLFRFDSSDSWTFESCGVSEQNGLVRSFLERGTAGLIVFTSGSTGRPKGILQDCERVMRKFVDQRRGWRTLLFLMMDHFGGFNTLLSTFAYGGVGVCLPDRNPEIICRVIEQSRATLLPVTPTFLNLLIASRCYQQYDLSSIELISYGTEVMPATTLDAVKAIFPNARIKQTYGLSELGVLRSKSESDDSVWVRIGGEGFETKVVDTILWIRSEANMVGYLNADDPFDSDGWMCTGDRVEVRGEYMRILGRLSDMINVGGQKVFPAEVESVLLEADNVRAATIYGDRHPLMGQVVKARVSLYEEEDSLLLSERLRAFCVQRMAKYKVPIRFFIVDESEQYTARYKKKMKFAGDA